MSNDSSIRDLQADLQLALSMADAADAISMARYQALDLVIETKPDSTPVTDADKATEVAIRALINQVRSNDEIVGEEFGAPEVRQGKYCWIIDPIDGTKNFLRGVPTWATLIALADPTGEIVVGVVSAPALFRRWYAVAGSGAFVSVNAGPASKISVSAVKKLSDASIAYSDLQGWGDRKSAFLDLQDRVWRTRGMGDFWSHMLVAEGAVDLAVEPSLALWDMAALDIVVREAGGAFTNIEGTAGPYGASAISSNGLLHQEFLQAIN